MICAVAKSFGTISWRREFLTPERRIAVMMDRYEDLG